MKRWRDAILHKNPVHTFDPTTGIRARIPCFINQSNYKISQDISLQSKINLYTVFTCWEVIYKCNSQAWCVDSQIVNVFIFRRKTYKSVFNGDKKCHTIETSFFFYIYCTCLFIKSLSRTFSPDNYCIKMFYKWILSMYLH